MREVDDSRYLGVTHFVVCTCLCVCVCLYLNVHLYVHVHICARVCVFGVHTFLTVPVCGQVSMLVWISFVN